MRSKIVFRTDLPIDRIQAFLQEQHWIADPQSKAANDAKQDILAAVALEHKDEAVNTPAPSGAFFGKAAAAASAARQVTISTA